MIAMEEKNLEEDSSYYYLIPRLCFEDHWPSNPQVTVSLRGLPAKTVFKYIHKSKVSAMNDSDQVYWNDIKQDAENVDSELKNIHPRSEYQQDYLDVIMRFFELYEIHSGSIPRNHQILNGDPNTFPFHLPKSVEENKEMIRSWSETWQSFDLEMPEDGPWGFETFEKIRMDDFRDFVLLTTDELYREDFHSGIELNHEIDGDAAWEVLPVDVIKDDVTLPTQDEILLSRDKRTDLDDLVRMKKRRDELAAYFIRERGDEIQTYCDKFLVFTATLEDGWKQFQSLCEKDS